MVKVFCDMCGREIDYEVDGVNLDFNHYGVVNFKTPFSAEKQLCLTCAARVCNFVENGTKMDGGSNNASEFEKFIRGGAVSAAEIGEVE